MRHTKRMRIYIPATAADLHAAEISPRWAHAVTPALRDALPQEDDEGCAESAMLAAADESLMRLREAPTDLARRVVVVADAAPATVQLPPQRSWQPGDDRLPSAVQVTEPVGWHEVAAIYVDEATSSEIVHRAMTIAETDTDFERANDAAYELDLLWYDVVELDRLREDLARAES